MQSKSKLLRDIKVKKRNVLLSGLVEVSAIPFRRVMVDFIRLYWDKFYVWAARL